MIPENISVEAYCSFYQIEPAFIQQLEQHGLLTFYTDAQQTYLSYEQLPEIERYIHLHYDLDINIAGIEAIHHLLNRMDEMQKKLSLLQNESVT
jgi:hypothetical protein